jgi:hypothetical protein
MSGNGNGQVYNMKGILRGIALEPLDGIPAGLSIERLKDGQPSGDVKFYSSADLGAAWEKIKESLKDLKKNQQIDYQTSNYKPIAVGAAGTLNKGKGGGGWGSPKSPEERRSIEKQKAADIVSRVYVACIDKSHEPIPKTFHEMMATIREETELLADVLGDRVKGGQ